MRDQAQWETQLQNREVLRAKCVTTDFQVKNMVKWVKH